MQIVIDIPEEIYNSACATNNIWDMRMAGFVCSAIANGIPIPSGHGGLIDINELITKLEVWDYKANGIPNYAWKCIKDAQVIIKADKRGEEDDKKRSI